MLLGSAAPRADVALRAKAFADLVGQPPVDDQALLHQAAEIPLVSQGGDGMDFDATLRMNPVPTAIAHMLDEDTPLVGFSIQNGTLDARSIRVSASIEGYTSRAVRTVRVEAGGTESPTLTPVFDRGRLRGVREMTRASLHISIEDLEAGHTVEATKAIWLTARTTAHLAVRDPSTGERTDLSRYLAAWVTPNADEVQQLLRTAAQHADFVGYQGGGDAVDAQVRACFDACAALPLKYVHSIIAAGGDDVQRVRLPRETLHTKSANCIDGTVLLASMLEAASLAPAIVLVPGHAFLAWRQAEAGTDWSYVDTTFMGKADFAAARAHAAQLAEVYRGLQQEHQLPQIFRLHAIDELRRDLTVLPME